MKGLKWMILKEEKNKPGTRGRLRKGLQILVDGLTGLTGLKGLKGLTGLTELTGLTRCMYVCR